jgi:hypothetical protein
MGKMLNVVSRSEVGFLPHDPRVRGYHAVYRPEQVNHCPGCGRSHWIVGRLLAECGFCATALPLADGGMSGIGLFRRNVRSSELDTPLAA